MMSEERVFTKADLDNAVTWLAGAREQVASTSASYDLLMEQMRATDLYRSIEDARKAVLEAESNAECVEEEVRTTAISIYKADDTKNKRPHGAVTVTDTEVAVVVDQPAAIRWAVEHKLMAMLDLNVKVAAQTVTRGGIAIDGIDKVQRISTKISKDLSEYLDVQEAKP